MSFRFDIHHGKTLFNRLFSLISLSKYISFFEKKDAENITFKQFKNSIIDDYKIAVTSRQASLIGRKEVLTGKAKFGIFGDGKELAQLAMARVLEKEIIDRGITVTKLL